MSDHSFSEDIIVQIWQHALHAFLGWDADRVVTWARQYEKGIRDENSWFYHEGPMFYVAHLILPNTVTIRSSGEAPDLCRRFDNAIGLRIETVDDLKTFDWNAAAIRVKEMLQDWERLQN